jgi:hypothetical protein
MNDDVREQMDAQEERQLTATGAQVGMQTAQRSQEKKIQNEQFLNELRKADIDSEVFDWAEDEFPTWFSGAHAVSNRSETWEEEADLLMMNKRERAFAEQNPGRLLRDRPMLRAIAQGRTQPDPANPSQPQPTDPMTSEERRVVYGAAEVAADLMSLSKNKAGLDATTTATTETRVTREQEEQGTASKVGKVFE